MFIFLAVALGLACGVVLALYGTLPDLERGHAGRARKYLDDFYSVIEDPRAVKRELIDGCLKKPGA